MSHPLIERIDDVLPALEGREEFVVAERAGFTVIDYRYVTPDSFDNEYRAECRGLKFAPDGRLLARPLHKFFNFGEKSQTSFSEVDFSIPHHVFEKMDGSMIHPAIVDGRVRLMTRMGLSDVALEAERLFLGGDLEWALGDCLAGGVTPIFEYIAPENRIVVEYDEPELVFLTARETYSGVYKNPDFLPWLASFFGVRLAPSYPQFSGHGDVLAIHGRAEGEGVVLQFADGLWLKVKTDEYRRLHRIRDDVSREHDLVRLILDGSIDDAYPLFDEATRAKVQTFAAEVMSGIKFSGVLVDNLVVTGAAMDQKTFAVDHLSGQKPLIRSACFTARKDAAKGFDVVRDMVLRKTNNAAGFTEVRPLCGDARLDLKVYMGDAG